MTTKAALNPVIGEDLRFIAGHALPWHEFEGKTVIVSGANGFLPAYMVETLLYLNDHTHGNRTRVIGIVRDAGKARARFAHHAGRKDFELIVQDICLPLDIGGGVDYIIHAASQASPKYYGIDPVGTLAPNVFGTRNLLELAREKGSKGFLFFSSGEVYGEASEIPTGEGSYGRLDPLDVRSCYAESKRMGENMCACWHAQYGVPAKAVRPFHTYGPGLRLDDGRVFADFVSDVVHGRDITMRSDGSALRAFCYIADATLGFFKVMLEGKNAEAYNVGNDKGETSILALAGLLAGLFPEKGLKVIRKEGGQAKGYMKSPLSRNCPDISKMRSLGWEPEYSLEEGFKRTIRSYF